MGKGMKFTSLRQKLVGLLMCSPAIMALIYIQYVIIYYGYIDICNKGFFHPDNSASGAFLAIESIIIVVALCVVGFIMIDNSPTTIKEDAQEVKEEIQNRIQKTIQENINEKDE